MDSAVISFRASGTFLGWLHSQVLSGESVSQAAQRVLKSLFFSELSPTDETVDTVVDTVDSVSPGLDSILQRLDVLEARLFQLESPFELITEPIAEPIANTNKQLTIFDALADVEVSLKSSGLLGLSIEAEENYLLREDLEKSRADYDSLLKSSDSIITKLRGEVQQLRSKLHTEERDRDELEEKLNQAELELMAAKSDLTLPDSADLLNALKTRRKFCRVTIPDIEAIFKLL